MIELLQFFSMIVDHRFYMLVLFMLIFVMAPIIVMKLRTRRYKPYNGGESFPVSVIVPVYKEDYYIFHACLESIARQQPAQLIVSIDSGDQKLIDIAKSFGAEIIEYPKRGGKRQAIADAWLRTRNEIIVHVDSDVVLAEGCLREISKPFRNEKVAAVSSRRIPVRGKSFLAWTCSAIVELNSNVNAKALDGGLVVIDGRCNAWRKKYLLSIRDEFLKDVWLGVRGEIGEDRFISRDALKKGYLTVFQETAKVLVITPDSLVDFMKQQLRWRRSGVKFFLMDVGDHFQPSFIYGFHSFTYYLAPFAFGLAVTLDLLFFHVTAFWSIYWVPVIVLVGSTAITGLQQTILLGKPFRWLYLPIQAVIGLILIFPIDLYASLTVRNQSSWVTRTYETKVSPAAQRSQRGWVPRTVASEAGFSNVMLVVVTAVVGVTLAGFSVFGGFWGWGGHHYC